MNKDKTKVLLQHMLEDMESAPDLFKPTNFWDSGLTSILQDIEEYGIDTFRSHKSAAFFYVPRYASNTYSKYSSFLDPLLTRLPPRKEKRWRTRFTHSDRAWADYRLYRASEISDGMNFDLVSESSYGGGERFNFDGLDYSYSMLNYMRALNLLKKHVDTSKLSSCLEIGGGYGTLGEIILKAQEGSIYVNVDIPPVAAVSTWYLSKVFGEENVLSYSDSREMASLDLDELRGKYKAIVLCPWQLPLLKGEFDLFANFMSFQEMEPDVVRNYISLVQPLIGGHALIRNSALGKKTAKKAGDIGVFDAVLSDFIVNEFNELNVLARDSVAHGGKSEDGSYCSEVIVLKR